MVESATQGNSVSKEISVDSIARGINSAKDVTTKVEATRFSLQYLLAKGRPNHALTLLSQTHSQTLPFSEDERSRMLSGILKSADSLLERDPLEAWRTVGHRAWCKTSIRLIL